PESYLAAMANLKFCVLVSLAPTVIEAVWGPSRSCHGVISEVRGSSPEIVNLPSVPVAEKNGCVKTAMKACIQGWTSHLIVKTASGFENTVVASFSVGGMALLNEALTFGSVWTLWSTPSELRILYCCPTMIPITCGLYWLPF